MPESLQRVQELEMIGFYLDHFIELLGKSSAYYIFLPTFINTS